VDDNPELLTLLSSSFEEAGYRVITAARGRTALDLARKEKPALAVVDILLPDLMGFDVAEVLKRLQIPFLFISGVHKGGKTSFNVRSRYGAIGFFEKPFERQALLDAVRKAVPVKTPGRTSQAFDVEAGPQIAEAAEAMQLTARIDLKSGSMRGTSPLQLRPMDREQMNRLRSVPPVISSRRVNTGPISSGSKPPSGARSRPAIRSSPTSPPTSSGPAASGSGRPWPCAPDTPPARSPSPTTS